MEQRSEEKYNWEQWSIFVIKSIERIEQSIKEINKKVENMIDNFNLSIIKLKSDIEKRIEAECSEIKSNHDKDVNELKVKDSKFSKEILKNKIKLGIVIVALSTVGSAALTYLVKLIFDKIF